MQKISFKLFILFKYKDQWYLCNFDYYDGEELERINYKKYLSGGSKLYLEIQEEKQKKLDEQNKNGQKKKRK